MTSEWNTTGRKAVSGDSGKSTSSITISLKCAGVLCIEKNGPQLFKLIYRDCSGKSNPCCAGDIRRQTLEDSLHFFDFITTSISTKLGKLVVSNRKEVRNLRVWLSSLQK